jgi:hypothetical protein
MPQCQRSPLQRKGDWKWLSGFNTTLCDKKGCRSVSVPPFKERGTGNGLVVLTQLFATRRDAAVSAFPPSKKELWDFLLAHIPSNENILMTVGAELTLRRTNDSRPPSWSPPCDMPLPLLPESLKLDELSGSFR